MYIILKSSVTKNVKCKIVGFSELVAKTASTGKALEFVTLSYKDLYSKSLLNQDLEETPLIIHKSVNGFQNMLM